MPSAELLWVLTAKGGPLLLRRAGKTMAGDAIVSFVQISFGRDLLLP